MTTRPRTAALVLASLLTVSTLLGIERLARVESTSSTPAAMAQASAPRA